MSVTTGLRGAHLEADIDDVTEGDVAHLVAEADTKPIAHPDLLSSARAAPGVAAAQRPVLTLIHHH